MPMAMKIGTPKLRRMVLDFLPWKNAHELRDISDIMEHTTLELYEAKKKALAEGDESVRRQIAQGNDIISILSTWALPISLRCLFFSLILSVRANTKVTGEDQLPENEVIAQMS